MTNRRAFLKSAAALTLFGSRAAAAAQTTELPFGNVFDAHCHIIAPGFPLVENQGYKPPYYTLDQYRRDTTPLGVKAGAVVSGSFQGFDQTYLLQVLEQLGPDWVGVTQLPPDIEDAELLSLARKGVRALRFNLFRGRVDDINDIVSLATRAHAIGGMHAEIYANAADLRPHVGALAKLPRLAIDHMGMDGEGLPVVLDLVDSGAYIKATGFGRVKMDIPKTLTQIARHSERALVFGTDLPSTRAARPFQVSDMHLIHDVLGQEAARKAFWNNAVDLYRPQGLKAP